MRTRVGKIARLPEAIRERLNRRLLNGALGRETVIWLNQLPDVKKVVAQRFAGRPVSEHNLSEWRHGGYQDWLRQIESRTRVLRIAAQCPTVEFDPRLGHPLQRLVTAELIDAAEQLHEIENDAARFQELHRICRETARLQNLHSRGLELRLQQEQEKARRAAVAAARTS